MLYYCAYTWNQGTTDAQVRRRIAEVQIPSGVTVRGYFPFVGGGAGFLLLETDDPEQLRDLLVQSMDLIHWDVRAVTEGNWQQEVERSRQATG